MGEIYSYRLEEDPQRHKGQYASCVQLSPKESGRAILVAFGAA